MCKFKTSNDKIITDNQIEDILDLVTGTLLNGVTSHDEVSLFEVGFLYDTKTEILLMTVPSYKWLGLDGELYFSVNSLKFSIVNKFYLSNKNDIDKTMLINETKWNSLNELDKLFLLEQYNGWLSIKFPSMRLTYDELINFLIEYINKNYNYKK